ncbi:hypothetical protein C8F01DRAFT_1136766 [Mycena amicta]|nr:hypothetical protein C8F01DRAFT_1136766 [Mycena amicta]
MRSITTLLICLLTAAARVSATGLVLHERLAEIPLGFTQLHPAPVSTLLSLRIGLPVRDSAGMEAALYRISDPLSAEYLHHLSTDEVDMFLRPSKGSLLAVTQWLDNNHIAYGAVRSEASILDIQILVDQANELLGTQFFHFMHIDSGETSIRALNYSIPASLRPHIDFINPIISFTPAIVPVAFDPAPDVLPTDNVDAVCALSTSLSCIQQLYGIPPDAIAEEPLNSMAVTAFQGYGELLNNAAITQFVAEFRRGPITTPVITQVSLDAGAPPQPITDPFQDLPNLNMEYQIGLAGKRAVFISVGTATTDMANGLFDLVDFLNNNPTIPQPKVLLIPFTISEALISDPVMSRVCIGFAGLGAQGISVIVSTGDEPPGPVCTLRAPTFPASCPFVTTVGGTAIIFNSSSGLSSESATAVSLGGESNYFPVPGYQAAQVKASLGPAHQSRCYPDVSAVANNFITFAADGNRLLNSTTGSATVFASMILLLNDIIQSRTEDLRSLGFLNPLLYSTFVKAAYNDVVTGLSSVCTNTFPITAPGWDLATGFGSVNYTVMENLLFKLPLPPAVPTAAPSCNSTIELCFDSYFGNYMTLGFALPPPGAPVTDELMISTAFPFPYGYVGLLEGYVDLACPLCNDAAGTEVVGTVWWFDVVRVAESVVLEPGNNHTLFPEHPVTVTQSNITSDNSTHANIILRCQNCSVITNFFATKPLVNLTMIFSLSNPVLTGDLATLPLNNSVLEQFQLLVADAQFGNYSAMLQAAGFLTTDTGMTTMTSTTMSVTSSTTTTRTTGSMTSVLSTTTSSSPSGTGGMQPQFAQCGGIGWLGGTVCVSPFTCTVLNPFFSQCL